MGDQQCTWCRGDHVCVDCSNVADGEGREHARIVAILEEMRDEAREMYEQVASTPRETSLWYGALVAFGRALDRIEGGDDG